MNGESEAAARRLAACGTSDARIRRAPLLAVVRLVEVKGI
jgi:hypothetical protein